MLRFAGLLTVVATLTGCAYHNPTAPTPPAVSDTAPAFLTLGVPSANTVSAYVQNAHGAPLEGVMVQFASDAGSLSPTSAATLSNGRAASTLSAATDAHVTATVGTLSARATVTAPVTPPTQPTPTPPAGPPSTPNPPPPSVFLNVSSTATTGQPVTFTVSSTATGAVWLWTFGDGGSAQTTAFTTTHAYGAAGTYQAAVSAAGTATGTATITVKDGPPPPSTAPSLAVSLIANPTSVAVGGSTTLMATATPVNGAAAVTGYTFDCGDGSAPVSTPAAVVSHTCTYSAAGFFPASVVATNGSVSGSASTQVTVTAPPPPATPVVTVTCNTVTFATPPSPCVVSATLNSVQVAGSQITITSWDWGDGGAAGATGLGAVNQSHTYAAANSAGYHVVVAATVPGGAGAGTGSGTAIVN